MKKKIAAVLLIALVVLSGAFAWGAKKGPEMMIGAKSGWGMDMTFTEVGNKTVTSKINNVPILVDFNMDLDAPVSIKASLGGNLHFYSDENTTSDAKGSFAFNVAGAYRYDASKDLALKAGLGFGYNLKSWSNDTIKTSYTVHSFKLYLDCTASYDVADHVVLNGGITLGGTVASTGTVKSPVGTTKMDNELPTNFSFGFNIGAAYKF